MTKASATPALPTKLRDLAPIKPMRSMASATTRSLKATPAATPKEVKAPKEKPAKGYAFKNSAL